MDRRSSDQRRTWYAGTIFVLVLVLVSYALYQFNQAEMPGPPPTRTTERVLGRAPIFASRCWSVSRVPSGCIFGLSGVQSIVLSSFAYEGNLIGGRYPVGDDDYMLGYGIQQTVKLPGGSWDHYAYYGSDWVAGSGCVLEFGTPNGGRFAFLHMAQNGYGCAPQTHRPEKTLDAQSQLFLSGDERTAAAVLGHIGLQQIAVGSVSGGHWVGRSQWPTWTLYGNGSCCQADAHLCVVVDGPSLAWFQRIAAGRDAPPWRFNYTRWNAWTVAHHERSVSPWRSASCTGKRSCLTWPAAVFDRHQRLGGKKRRDYWIQSRGQAPYNIYRYAAGRAFCWPRYRSCKEVFS